MSHDAAMAAIKARAIRGAVHALPLPLDVCARIVQLACRPDAPRTRLAREGARRTLRYATLHVARFSRGDVAWTFVRRP
jgi:hypothetical protein